MKNRYDMAKLWYDDYVILLLKRDKLYTYINDKLISFKSINKLKRLHINYIILDNMEVYKKEYKDNNYNLYYLQYMSIHIVNSINKKIREWVEEYG